SGSCAGHGDACSGHGVRSGCGVCSWRGVCSGRGGADGRGGRTWRARAGRAAEREAVGCQGNCGAGRRSHSIPASVQSW
ncbi:MAG: hypothetical protein ACRDPF_23610, partial [Streptosporangiaceae bacterium]